jgi:hypothetical protein
MSYPPHTRYYLGFNLVRGIGPIRQAHLVEHCGSLEAAWNASTDDLRAAGLDAKTCAALADARQRIDLDGELERLAQMGIRVLTLDDADYPRLLREARAAAALCAWYPRSSRRVGCGSSGHTLANELRQRGDPRHCGRTGPARH